MKQLFTKPFVMLTFLCAVFSAGCDSLPTPPAPGPELQVKIDRGAGPGGRCTGSGRVTISGGRVSTSKSYTFRKSVDESTACTGLAIFGNIPTGSYLLSESVSGAQCQVDLVLGGGGAEVIVGVDAHTCG